MNKSIKCCDNVSDDNFHAVDIDVNTGQRELYCSECWKTFKLRYIEGV